MTSLYRTGNDDYGPDWKPCDCPIHDQVAEMLGLVSTSGKDFRPASCDHEWHNHEAEW